MITIAVTYVIDAAKKGAFEVYAREWIRQVNLHGGTHHGYFVADEGAGDTALSLFSRS